MREKVRPKMGKIDIDYQKLHDAFFKWQIKPKLTIHGDLYYEVILELVSYSTVWVALTFLWEVFPEEIFFSLSIFYLFFSLCFYMTHSSAFPSASQGKEFETRLKEKKPGDLSDELRIALGMPTGPVSSPSCLSSLHNVF